MCTRLPTVVRSAQFRVRSLTVFFATAVLMANTMPLSAQLTAPLARTTREVVVDANKEQLVGFNSLVLNPAGGFVIPQQQTRQVLFFDNSGKRLVTTGRGGQGPGEFTEIGRLGWLADTLWVNDSRDARTSLFTPAGNYIRLIRRNFQSDSVPPAFAARGHRTMGNFLAMGLVPGLGFVGTATGGPATKYYFISISETGTNVAILADQPMPKVGATVRTSGSATGDMSMAVAQIPHLPEPLWNVAATGAAIAIATTDFNDGNRGQVHLKVLSPHGATILEKSYPFTSSAVPRESLDTVVNRIRARTSQTAQVKAQLETQVREQFPRYHPPVTALRLTKDRSIWLELGKHATTRTWLRLDAQGNPIHTIILPRNARFEESDGDVIWVSETDSDDLRHVVRYRIQR